MGCDPLHPAHLPLTDACRLVKFAIFQFPDGSVTPSFNGYTTMIWLQTTSADTATQVASGDTAVQAVAQVVDTVQQAAMAAGDTVASVPSSMIQEIGSWVAGNFTLTNIAALATVVGTIIAVYQFWWQRRTRNQINDENDQQQNIVETSLYDSSTSTPALDTGSEVIPPKVFISYKWQDDEHNTWVEKFYTDLRTEHGIDAQLDKFEVDYGESFSDYMTRQIDRECDAMLFVVTSAAVTAVDQAQTGGVYFEMQLANARRLREGFRIIGIYREGNENTAYLKDHRYIDFRDNAFYEDNLKELADSLWGRRRKPVLGVKNYEIGKSNAPESQSTTPRSYQYSYFNSNSHSCYALDCIYVTFFKKKVTKESPIYRLFGVATVTMRRPVESAQPRPFATLAAGCAMRTRQIDPSLQ